MSASAGSSRARHHVAAISGRAGLSATLLLHSKSQTTSAGRSDPNDAMQSILLCTLISQVVNVPPARDVKLIARGVFVNYGGHN